MPKQPDNFGDLAFTPMVKAVQERLGSRQSYARLEGRSVRTHIGSEEAEFIAGRDSFYISSVGENGWPYIQHRGGPKGLLRLLNETTLGFADFRGNRQYVSTGNVLSNGKVCLFLMDYPTQSRLKIWAEAKIADDLATLDKLADKSYDAVIERAFIFHVLAFDWNCQQHIVPRYTPQEFAAFSDLASPVTPS